MAEIDVGAVKRGTLYLKAAGLTPSEAQSLALSTWADMAEGEGLAAFMARLRACVEGRLPKARSRPLCLGHMPTASFSVSAPAQEERKEE